MRLRYWFSVSKVFFWRGSSWNRNSSDGSN